jgi:hypothetical protein
MKAVSITWGRNEDGILVLRYHGHQIGGVWPSGHRWLWSLWMSEDPRNAISAFGCQPSAKKAKLSVERALSAAAEKFRGGLTNSP